jgi:energy-coupling factor transport system substrate-specific component
MNVSSRNPVWAFLLCGSLAAAINWLARLALSNWIGFEAAVVLAYAIGMIAGFMLYRSFVWPDAANSFKRQLAGFVAVNAASGLIVLITAVGLVEAAALLVPRSAAVEALAHAAAISVGAAANFVGHGLFTFGKIA